MPGNHNQPLQPEAVNQFKTNSRNFLFEEVNTAIKALLYWTNNKRQVKSRSFVSNVSFDPLRNQGPMIGA